MSRKRRSSGRGVLIAGSLLAFGIVILAALPRDEPSAPDPTTERFDIGGRPAAIAVSGGATWVASDDGTSVRLDRAGEAVERVAIGRNPAAVGLEGPTLWVGHATGKVTRVELGSRHKPSHIDAGESITGLAFTKNRVWAADIAGKALVGIDAKEAKVVRRIRVPKAPVRVVSTGRYLWTTNRENTVTRVDPRSGRVGPVVRVGNGPIGLAADDTTLWVANSDDGTVSRLDAATGVMEGGPIRVGRGPVAVAVRGGKVWVANQDDRTVTRIDPVTGRVVGRPIGVGTHIRDMAAASDGVWLVGVQPAAIVRLGE